MSNSSGTTSNNMSSMSGNGQFEVTVKTSPEMPSVNQPTDLTIVVKNKATGQAVTDAKVDVEIMMKSNMPGMNMSGDSVIRGQAKADMEPGMYMLNVKPTKQGEWTETIHVTSPSQGETTAHFVLQVAKSGPNWVLIGTVAGIVVIAGIFVLLLRRKK